MKALMLGVAMMASTLTHQAFATGKAKDEATIKTLVESVGLLADTHNFEALEKLYSDEVMVDYTSLVGGEPQLKSNTGLMTEWASFLPGFDRTRHEVSDIEVDINGAEASVTAGIVAHHYVDDLYWQVRGTYLYKLEREEGNWRITSHTLNLTGEEGTRDVFAAAGAYAEQRAPAYKLRQQTQKAVRDFLESLEEKDMERFANVWAEDAVQDMPYSPEGFPKRVNGRDNLIKHYSGWPEASGENSDFTSELVFYPMQDPEMVFAEFKSRVDIVPTGRQYKQNYGGLFHVKNGKITLFREYYDPAIFKHAFGLDEGGNFHPEEK